MGGIFLLQSKEMQLKSYFDGQNSTPQAGKTHRYFSEHLKNVEVDYGSRFLNHGTMRVDFRTMGVDLKPWK